MIKPQRKHILYVIAMMVIAWNPMSQLNPFYTPAQAAPMKWSINPASVAPVMQIAIKTKADYKTYAFSRVLASGWSSQQFICLESLWTKESNWNPLSTNRSSGAHGIPQALPASKMATTGADYAWSAKTQINWGIKYISTRYTNPCRAWYHWQKNGWY